MSRINKIKQIPQNPGCYIMKNSLGKVIYVGKAKNLKKRVTSYFKKNNDYKTTLLVKDLADIEFFITNNELEALLLEAKLIRKYKPMYNLMLKDSERYAFIKITDEEFPRIITARQKTKDGKYFGPYPDGTARRNTIFVLNRAFKLRVCGPKMPKRECLYYHIKQCSAPCINKISKTEYLNNIKKAEMYLKGKGRELVLELEKEMKEFSQKKMFEQARERRDQIFALKKISQKQIISLDKKYNQDIINYLQIGAEITFQIFNINKGLVSNKQEYKLNSLKGGLPEFIKQYYFTHEIPEEIIIPLQIEEQDLIEKYLTKLKGKKVEIIVPMQGTKKQLLNLIKENLALGLSDCEKILLLLQEELNLDKVPKTIECFDISNLQEKWTVGSMVHFSDCRPDKNNYRRFKIKFIKGQNDTAMIKEIVFRRYYRLVAEKAPMPDLIMIDGGKAQLHAAKSALEKLGLNIPLISLAKRMEEIYTLNKDEPVLLSKKNEALKLLQRIRDEAHRFAVKYHRLLRERVV